MPQNTIIHGHFYQTPACNHWTGIAASDPHSQNGQNRYERITAECYAPNSASRILGNGGKILNIINNYQYISFDFDPTLLDWLSREHSDVYNRIIEADKLSAEAHNGHGNAVAQIYSHIIMPLATFEDKKTAVIWGLRNFEYHFGRKSEGLWLPETAVDYQTIDLLIEQGVRFIILSPDQLRACRKAGEKEWTLFDDDNYADTNAAYRITRAHGEIAVLCCNKSISDAVSFEHLLRDADNFAGRILSANETEDDEEQPQNEYDQTEKPQKPQCVKVTDNTLVTIATDGKIYGHHEPFADMCLSGMITKYCINSDQIRLLNPAEYLEEYPPEYEILLKTAADVPASSWSCPHGVGRWYCDCGCRSDNGESQQSWRTPLREALMLVKNEADEIYLRITGKYTDRPLDMRNGYIDFINSRYDIHQAECVTRYADRALFDDEVYDLLQLLEAQRCVMMMFNSDGWFGSDISDTASIWNLDYAHRVLNILERYGSKIRCLFEQKLAEAKSNIVKYDNGKNILEYFVYNNATGYEYIINNMLAIYRLQKNIDNSQFKLFALYNFDSVTVEAVAGQNNLYTGEVVIADRRTVVRQKFTYIYQVISSKSYRLFITDSANGDLLLAQADYIATGCDARFDGCMLLTENDLHPEIKNFIMTSRYWPYMQTLMNQSIADYGDVRMLVNAYKSLGMELPDYLQSHLLVCADAFIQDMSDKLNTFPTADEYKLLHEVFGMLSHYKVQPHAKILSDKVSYILTESLKAADDILSETYSEAVSLMQFCSRIGLQIDRTSAENVIFTLYRKQTKAIVDILPTVSDESQRNLYLLRYKQLIVMADICNIVTSNERKMMMNYLTDSETDNPHRF